MSYPTVQGRAVEGLLYREAQICLGPKFANSYYLFFLSGTSTPVNVYSNGTLTTPFPSMGRVTSDNFGRFPAIYLDTSVTYRVQFFDSTNTQRWQVDPYISQLSTVGTSSLSAFGVQISTTGEVIIPAPNTGGSGISLTLDAGSLGSTPLQVSANLPGNSALIVNSSATTGAQTATFAASNKPGTATSSPAGWLPITCDGVQYYTPIWHGNNFTPYVANPTALGEVIVASSVTFNGNGTTTATGGTATPANWFSPAAVGIGAGYYINITKTGGLSGVNFSAAQGSWTNITAGGLTISSNAQAAVTGTYSLSTSVSGTPIVASGTISLSNNNGVQSPIYNGATPLILAGNGTATLNGSAASNWYAPTTASIGSGFYILITQVGGTSGTTFTAATGAYTNITAGGLTIGITGGSGVTNATGSYIIASDSGGVNQLGSGTITLTAGTLVQSPNWSGTTPLKLNGDGSATLNGAGTSSWYAPNTANVGSGYWIDITRTGGSGGVNFTAAQGSWTNITNSGLTIDISGYSGVGTFTASGTWQISNSSSGTPVLGSGTISLSITTTFTPTTTTFTTAGANLITIPTNSSSMTLEAIGGSGGGGGGNGTTVGNGGSSGSRCVSTYAIASGDWGKTLTLTCAASLASTGVNNNTGQVGNPSTVVAGTFAGFTSMTAGGGGGGFQDLGGANAANPATGGNVTNQSGTTNSVQRNGASGLTGTYVNGLAGATGASIVGGVAHPDTATTIGQGAVHFS
jgi:mucin-19